MSQSIQQLAQQQDDGDNRYLKAQAIQKTEHALRCIRDHAPPLWDIAAGSLAIALEHVRTLHAISEQHRRAKPKSIAPPADGGRA